MEPVYSIAALSSISRITYQCQAAVSLQQCTLCCCHHGCICRSSSSWDPARCPQPAISTEWQQQVTAPGQPVPRPRPWAAAAWALLCRAFAAAPTPHWQLQPMPSTGQTVAAQHAGGHPAGFVSCRYTLASIPADATTGRQMVPRRMLSEQQWRGAQCSCLKPYARCRLPGAHMVAACHESCTAFPGCGRLAASRALVQDADSRKDAPCN